MHDLTLREFADFLDKLRIVRLPAEGDAAEAALEIAPQKIAIVTQILVVTECCERRFSMRVALYDIDLIATKKLLIHGKQVVCGE